MDKSRAVLFVCLGNICRSPLAEVVFRSLVEEKNLESQFTIASCGTGHWHEGQPAHKESRRIATKHGINLENHVARQLDESDFEMFDLIVAMDRSNRDDILSAAGRRKVAVCCLREFDNEADSLDVPDPYFGGRDGFAIVYAMIHRSCVELLDQILQGRK